MYYPRMMLTHSAPYTQFTNDEVTTPHPATPRRHHHET